ncbi:MAG: hypothetical protein U0610_06680 [bacterium]
MNGKWKPLLGGATWLLGCAVGVARAGEITVLPGDPNWFVYVGEGSPGTADITTTEPRAGLASLELSETAEGGATMIGDLTQLAGTWGDLQDLELDWRIQSGTGSPVRAPSLALRVYPYGDPRSFWLDWDGCTDGITCEDDQPTDAWQHAALLGHLLISQAEGDPPPASLDDIPDDAPIVEAHIRTHYGSGDEWRGFVDNLTLGFAGQDAVTYNFEIVPDPGFGAILFQSIRNCAGVPSQESCVVDGNTNLVLSHAEGGLGAEISSRRGAIGLGTVYGSTTFNGTAALPILRASALPSASSRNASTQQAYQRYTFTGPQTVPLPIQATLDFSYSPPSVGQDSEWAGGGFLLASLAVLDGSLVTAQDLSAIGLAFLSCGDEALYGLPANAILAADYFMTDTAPAQSVTLDASKVCFEETALTVDPGDSFLVSTAIQAIANRGGLVNAEHTLTVDFAPETAPADLEALVAGIQPSCTECGPGFVFKNGFETGDVAGWSHQVPGF